MSGRVHGRRKHARLAAIGAAALCIVVTAPAAAAEPCAHVRVASGGELGPRWQQAIHALESDVEKLISPDCTDATIVVLRQGGGVRLEVTAADGRHARRLVETPSELGAVASGLLASIPAEPPAEPAVAITETSTSLLLVAPPERTPERAPPASRAPVLAPGTLGLTFGTRVGFPTGVIAPEVEVRGDFRFNRWIMSLSGRGSPTGTRFDSSDASDYEFTEFAFGVFGGREVPLGEGMLSFSLGPHVGIVTEDNDIHAKTRTDLWFQTATRYVIPIGDRWRPAVALELDAAPRRIAAAVHEAALPPFPTWGASLRVGVVGDVP